MSVRLWCSLQIITYNTLPLSLGHFYTDGDLTLINRELQQIIISSIE